MDSTLNRSCSETNISQGMQIKTPPTNTINRSLKRARENNDDNIFTFKQEIKEIMTNLFKKQENELKVISSMQCEMRQSNLNIEKSITFLMSQNEEYKKKIDILERETQEDKKYILLLENRIEDIQRENRKANIVLNNVPVKKEENKEDLMDIVLSFTSAIGCPLNKASIKDIYRVRPKKQDMVRAPIIFETASTLIKSEIMKLTKSFNYKNQTKLRAKHLGFKTSEDTPIFVTEHLTTKGSRLYYLARDVAKSKKYKFCWTSYGKIYIRKNENSSIITIYNEAQIQQLLQQQ